MYIEEIKQSTKEILTQWKNVYGFAPNSVANKLADAKLDWIIQLTDSLEIWTKKHAFLTEGELLLARANIGAVVEGWLKFFYCVYYEDYKVNPVKTTREEMIEPNDLNFERLKQFSRGKLWELNDEWDKWIASIQHKRNAIHAFNNRDIGNAFMFINDVEKLKDFIELVNTSIPDISEFYSW